MADTHRAKLLQEDLEKATVPNISNIHWFYTCNHPPNSPPPYMRSGVDAVGQLAVRAIISGFQGQHRSSIQHPKPLRGAMVSIAHAHPGIRTHTRKHAELTQHPYTHTDTHTAVTNAKASRKAHHPTAPYGLSRSTFAPECGAAPLNAVPAAPPPSSFRWAYWPSSG